MIFTRKSLFLLNCLTLLITGSTSPVFASDSTEMTPAKDVQTQKRVITKWSASFPDIFFSSANQTIYSPTRVSPTPCASTDMQVPSYLNTSYTEEVKWYSTSIYYECGTTGMGSPNVCDYTDRYTDRVPQLTTPSNIEPKTICETYPNCNTSDVASNANIQHRCYWQTCVASNTSPSGWYQVWVYKPSAAGTIKPYTCITHGWRSSPIS